LNFISRNFHVSIPDELADEIDGANTEDILNIGVEWAAKQVKELLSKKVPSVHFYIMLNPKPIKMLMDRLKLF